MELETAGRPTVLVATSRFVGLALEAAQGYGLATPRIAVVEHPLGGTAESGVLARAAAAVEPVIRLLAARG